MGDWEKARGFYETMPIHWRSAAGSDTSISADKETQDILKELNLSREVDVEKNRYKYNVADFVYDIGA